MAPWFQSESYSPLRATERDEVPRFFDPELQELQVGALFKDKQTLMDAVRQNHIMSDRTYRVQKSSTTLWTARCTVEGCPWKIRVALLKKHGLFEVTKCPSRHNCMSSMPMQDHTNITCNFIANIVKPYVSTT